jgi:hypothetical protein
VTQRNGVIRLVKDRSPMAEPFVDVPATTVSNAGSALSTVAFHPDVAVAGSAGEGRFYTISQEAAGSGAAHFGAASPVAHQSVVYEWRVSAVNPDVADTVSRREILRVNEKTAVHNLNDLAFGPERHLYISKGDDDMTAAGVLDGCTVDGSVLRIDVDDTTGNGRYTVPPDNPFVGNDFVNFVDLALFRMAFGSADETADLDGSGGIVNFTDLALFRPRFGLPPGTSAAAP